MNVEDQLHLREMRDLSQFFSWMILQFSLQGRVDNSLSSRVGENMCKSQKSR
jgi:hypothetical protein